MNPTQQRAQELADARARLITHLQRVVGPQLGPEAAQAVLEQAGAWVRRSARQLDQHLTDHPDGLVAPSPHCPASLVRLLRVLQDAGHGHAVTQLGCASCGRTTGPLPRPTPAGRCCNWCASRDTLRECARCHTLGHIVTRRDEGPICRRCYHTDPKLLEECASCGRRRRPVVRREDGTAWCDTCAPRPQRSCVRCGTVARVEAISVDGPVCRRCHERPTRPCGICGQVRAVHVRASEEQPDICANCYRGPIGQCAACGRQRPGFTHRGGAFYCTSCQPRPRRPCQDCGRTRPTKVSHWPIGVLCASCYSRRKRNPRPCSRCGIRRVLVGRTPEGEDLCGPCCGMDSLDFTCGRCGSPGEIHADGCCARCLLGDRLHHLLGGHDGTVPAQLRPLTAALAAADHPRSVLDWLASSPSAALLARLAAHPAQITHDLIDQLPQDQTTRHVRETLVATGVLPPRQENLARLQLWLAEHTADLPADHARTIRPFAEWQVLRDARRRAARGRYTNAAATHDRTDIRVASQFLTWLDTRQRTLHTVTQADLDLWLTTYPTRHRRLVAFIRWANARHLTSTPLEIPARPAALPTHFLDDTEHYQQLRRCLNEDTLPREARITGALIRLYALPLTRVRELTTDQFFRDTDGAYYTFDRNPVLLPPKLATLIEEQINQPASPSMLPTPTDRRYLLPGRPPSRPRSASSLHKLLAQHGLPTLSARNTAMIEAVSELPPIVVSDLFGVAHGTTHRWAQYAQDSWADYLAARPITE